MIKKLKIGIAGYGVVGKRRGRCIKAHPSMELVAVCDRVFSANGSYDDGLRYYTNYKDLLTEDLDALFVCMTNDIAPEVTMAGLTKGLHVFCEKPPGRDVADIEKVIRCYEKNKRLKLMYGFNHRHHQSVRDALTIVQSGELGSVINMRGVYGKSKLITFNQTDWRTQRAIAGGGVLLDQGIHMVDLMRLFAGEFTDVHSFISNDYWQYDVEDNAYALMKTNGGVVAMLHSSATQWRHRFDLDITLQKGSLVLGGILSSSKSYGAETLRIVWANSNDSGDPKEQVTRYNKDPSWEEEVRLFADCVIQDDEVVSGSVIDAYQTMKLVYQIYCADVSWKKKYNLETGLNEVEHEYN